MTKKIKYYILGMIGALSLSTSVYGATQGTVNADILNVRSGPSTSYSVVDKTYYGQTVNIIEKQGEWYQIKTPNNQIAYVHSDYINIKEEPVTTSPSTTTQTETAIVNVDVLNLRATPSLSGNILGKLKAYEKITVLSTEGEWSQVKTSSNVTGYVYNSYITKINASSTEDVRSQVVSYAKQFLGGRYVYGGNSLTSGIDCSGFTQQILAKFGYKISRTSAMQYNDGKRISANELQPGDLVFYGYSGVVSHVAIYIGDGKIIHASDSKRGIIISDLYKQGSKPYIGSVRIIE